MLGYLKKYFKYLVFGCLMCGPIVLSSCKSNQGEQSLLLNIPYQEARKVILQNGWEPAAQEREEDLSSISRFLDKGYTEVDACSGTGMGYCSFHFKKDKNLFLIVTTQELPFGGYNPDLKNDDDAIVINYGISDKLD